MTAPMRLDMPTRDGARLATDVYLPEAGAGPRPVLAVRTPYDRRRFAEEAGFWRARGIAFVCQDVRGRYESTGDWRPYVHEHDDGADLLAWLSTREWAGEAFALKGASYEAYTALCAAAQGHPRLRTVISAVPVLGRRHIAHTDTGLLHLSSVAWWSRTHGGRRADDAAERALLADLPERLADRPVTELWRSLGVDRDGWLRQIGAEPAGVADVDLSRVRVPILHVGGWFDPFVAATLGGFGVAAGQAPQRVVVGPWQHDLAARPRVGARHIGDSGALDVPRLEWAWLRRWLLRRAPSAVAARGWFYVVGADRWCRTDSWPPPSTPMMLALADGRKLSPDVTTARGEGRLRSDPADPVPSRLAPVDQRAIHARPDVLTYTSDPLPAGFVLAGSARLTAVVTGDAPDTDLFAQLCEVLPDGRAILISHGGVRARHRLGPERTDLLTPGREYELTVRLSPVAVRLAAGSRIRLSLATTCFPYYDRTAHAATEPALAARAATATLSVSHGRSRLTLPILTVHIDQPEVAA
jgi:uncharacterized protein